MPISSFIQDSYRKYFVGTISLGPLHPFALLAYSYLASVLTAIALSIPLAEGCTTFPSLSLDVLMSLRFHERSDLIVT